MYASIRCVKCESEMDAVVPNDVRIGEEIQVKEAVCPECGGTIYVRILQTAIAKHSSWSSWSKQ